MEKKPFIKISRLRKTLDGVEILRGIDLAIHKGEIMAVIGASGAGKSVSLKCITGLFQPDSGAVFIGGRDITGMGMRELNKVRSGFGVLFQSGALFDSLNVYHNVAFPLKEKTRLKDTEIAKRVTKALSDVHLKDVEEKYPAELSGGMKKRVALARAIISNPDIIFFDEPTTGLDPVLKQSIHELIIENHQRHGFTGLIISHEIPDIFDVADRVAMLCDGKIIFCGTPDEIVRSQIPEVKSFVHIRDCGKYSWDTPWNGRVGAEGGVKRELDKEG
ncbi:MAG: ATP-binding cassette domain-containing protein [Nitrospirae bacterium]|nr:ATP-binding cassette domain-containing protein [Nitrospirota bacterium]MBF0535599.1 ATP-binding cassette domain-containing protein [Nitrospirota bacterium]MBF0617482.1 ATP-binding cassette domain-containing protein [Nitrospirota bacterium]